MARAIFHCPTRAHYFILRHTEDFGTFLAFVYPYTGRQKRSYNSMILLQLKRHKLEKSTKTRKIFGDCYLEVWFAKY